MSAAKGRYRRDPEQEDNKIRMWILGTLTPVLLAVIGVMIRHEFERIEGALDKLSEFQSSQNDRITHVEDAVISLKDKWVGNRRQ